MFPLFPHFWVVCFGHVASRDCWCDTSICHKEHGIATKMRILLDKSKLYVVVFTDPLLVYSNILILTPLSNYTTIILDKINAKNCQEVLWSSEYVYGGFYV